jgi:glycosyltransferase involved in cell wall biosynthesis
MAKPRLFILDPQMKDYLGHHLEYNQAVGEAALKLGLQPVVLANQSYALERDMDGVQYKPVFRFGQWDNQTSTWRIDLTRAMKAEKITAEDHVYFPTIYINEIEMLQSMMLLTPPDVMPHMHLFFRRDLDEYGSYEKHAVGNFFTRLNDQPAFAAKAQFYVDTPEMRDHFNPYARLANKEFNIVPIPLRQHLLGKPELRKAGDVIRVSYIGDARKEKGYAYLPQAVNYVLHHLPAGKKVEFVIQSGFDKKNNDPEIIAAVRQLEGMPHVSCPPGPFSSEEYHQLLKDADIVVLPHDPKPFLRRSSGTLADALGAGKGRAAQERLGIVRQHDDVGVF